MLNLRQKLSNKWGVAQKNSLGEMYQRAVWPSFILAVIGFALMQIASLNTQERDELQLNADTVSRVLAGAPNREIIYKWEQFPTQVYVSGADHEGLAEAVELVITEINDAAGLKAAEIVSAPDEAEIHLIFSSYGHNTFERYYADFFRDQFGQTQFDVWDDIGGFSFPYSSLHPAFGILLFDPEQVADPTFVDRNTPLFGMISIGEVRNMSNDFLIPLLREELAHLVFFIPDFVVSDGTESIFNANIIDNDRLDFSYFDKQLMAFLASHSTPGMSVGELLDIVKDF